MLKKALLIGVVALSSLITEAAKIVDHDIKSEKMGKTFKVRVILPDSYNDTKALPQAYLLHGAGGHHGTWSRDNLASQMADKYDRIMICPTAGSTSWYNDYNKSEDFIIEEVIPFVDKTYKTTKCRWITGLSMGGYGAIRLGYKYPKLFSAVGGQSACVKPSTWTNKWAIAANMGITANDTSKDNFMPEMIAKMKKDKRPLALLCGKQDFFFKENEVALADLKKAKINFYHEEMEGAHNWEFWKVSLPKQLEYFQKNMKKTSRNTKTKSKK